MTIKTNEIISTTIPEAIREIEEKFGITGDKAEAIASHIVYTDEDWNDVEDSPESDIEQDRRCHGKYQEEEEKSMKDSFKNFSATGKRTEVECPYCNSDIKIYNNAPFDGGIFWTCPDCSNTFIVSRLNQVSKLDWEVEKTRRKSFNLLPSEQQEAVKKAIAEFEEKKELFIEEPCNCGNRIQHNNGGNYHTWYDIKYDSNKYFIMEGSTSELEPPYQWEESTKEQVLQLIQNCADWL